MSGFGLKKMLLTAAAMLLALSLSSCVLLRDGDADSDALSSDSRIETSDPNTDDSANRDLITADEAKQAALAHAKVSEKDVTGLRVRLEYDDGRQEYEVDFYANGLEYDYDIDAVTGQVLHYDADIDDDFRPGNGAAPDGKIISEDEAKQAALAHAKVSEKDVTGLRVRLEYDDGRQEYEVDFYANGLEYDYDIDAVTGQVLRYDADIDDDFRPGNGAAPDGKIISEDEAKQAALAHAKVSEKDVTGLRVRLEYDDGRQEYEVDFYANGLEYDYDIDAVTGQVLHYDADIDDDFRPGNGAVPDGKIISEDEAKQAALAHAKVSEKDVAGLRVRLEYDDGRQEYEVDFYANGLEYDYDIDAVTGQVLRYDADIDDDFRPENSASGAVTDKPVNEINITESQAKDIALAQVPGAGIADVRIHVDFEDGKPIYEGSIVYGQREYDFEIDATTGQILEWEEESIFD